MVDPVVCVDGYTYERSNVEEWFKSQSGSSSESHVFTSPLTGEKLQSTLLIRNINLAKAIAKFGGGCSHLKPNKIAEVGGLQSSPVVYTEGSDSFRKFEYLQFSPFSLGRSITLDAQRSVAYRSMVPADTVDWYSFIAFSAFPARLTSEEKPRMLVKIEKTVTSWGGITIGFSPKAPDTIKTAEIKDFVDANCWWLDSNNWFHCPNGASVLVPWSTAKLRVGDTFGMIIPESRRMCFFVNREKVLDIKDAELPHKLTNQLYGFVALTGSYDSLRIIQDGAADWKV